MALKMRDSDPALYEERIQVRGQYVVWYSSITCFCISDNGRVDPNCTHCFGKGFIFKPIQEARRVIWGVSNGKSSIDISSKGIRLNSINRLIVDKETEYAMDSFTETSFTPVLTIPKGHKWTLDCVETFESTYSGAAVYLGNDLIEVPVKIVNPYGSFLGNITEVTSVYNDTKGEEIPVVNFWANQILVNSIIDVSDEITVTCKYVNPIKALLMGINPKAKLQDNLIYQMSDAQATLPGTYHVGRGDIFMLQTAETRESMVAINEGITFNLPYFKIGRILRIVDKFGVIEDYTLAKGNQIIWGSRIPERFSIVFTYHPAFSVLEDLPNIRYSEEKIFPKRFFLKKYARLNVPGKILSLQDPDIEDQGILESPEEEEEQGGLL